MAPSSTVKLFGICCPSVIIQAWSSAVPGLLNYNEKAAGIFYSNRLPISTSARSYLRLWAIGEMFIVYIVCAVIVIVCGAFLFCIGPNRDRREKMRPFEERYIAHRGLFDNDGPAPENSLLAFKKAVEGGYGIELDVQMTTDEKLVVFHDEYLERMCGNGGILCEHSYEELQQYTLARSREKIPLLRDVLDIVGGKVPLIVEIKSEGKWKRTCELTAGMLDGYDGIFCVESFHPFAVGWFRKHRPAYIRGQLSTNYFKDESEKGTPWAVKFVLTNLLLNFVSRPDFIAYNHKDANVLSYRICRSIFPVENVAWTVKSPGDLERAEKVFRVIIFDSFIPDAE